MLSVSRSDMSEREYKYDKATKRQVLSKSISLFLKMHICNETNGTQKNNLNETVLSNYNVHGEAE